MHTWSVHKHIHTHYLHTHRIHLFIFTMHSYMYTYTHILLTYTHIHLFIYINIHIVMGFPGGLDQGQSNLVGYSPWDCRESHGWATNTFTFISTLRWLISHVSLTGPRVPRCLVKYYSRCAVGEFGDEHNIWICRLSKADGHPQHGWAMAIQLKDWIEQKGWGKRRLCLPECLTWNIALLLPLNWSLNVGSPGLRPSNWNWNYTTGWVSSLPTIDLGNSQHP